MPIPKPKPSQLPPINSRSSGLPGSGPYDEKELSSIIGASGLGPEPVQQQEPVQQFQEPQTMTGTRPDEGEREFNFYGKRAAQGIPVAGGNSFEAEFEDIIGSTFADKIPVKPGTSVNVFSNHFRYEANNQISQYDPKTKKWGPPTEDVIGKAKLFYMANQAVPEIAGAFVPAGKALGFVARTPIGKFVMGALGKAGENVLARIAGTGVAGAAEGAAWGSDAGVSVKDVYMKGLYGYSQDQVNLLKKIAGDDGSDYESNIVIGSLAAIGFKSTAELFGHIASRAKTAATGSKEGVDALQKRTRLHGEAFIRNSEMDSSAQLTVTGSQASRGVPALAAHEISSNEWKVMQTVSGLDEANKLLKNQADQVAGVRAAIQQDLRDISPDVDFYSPPKILDREVPVRSGAETKIIKLKSVPGDIFAERATQLRLLSESLNDELINVKGVIRPDERFNPNAFKETLDGAIRDIFPDRQALLFDKNGDLDLRALSGMLAKTRDPSHRVLLETALDVNNSVRKNGSIPKILSSDRFNQTEEVFAGPSGYTKKTGRVSSGGWRANNPAFSGVTYDQLISDGPRFRTMTPDEVLKEAKIGTLRSGQGITAGSNQTERGVSWAEINAWQRRLQDAAEFNKHDIDRTSSMFDLGSVSHQFREFRDMVLSGKAAEFGEKKLAADLMENSARMGEDMKKLNKWSSMVRNNPDDLVDTIMAHGPTMAREALDLIPNPALRDELAARYMRKMYDKVLKDNIGGTTETAFSGVDFKSMIAGTGKLTDPKFQTLEVILGKDRALNTVLFAELIDAIASSPTKSPVVKAMVELRQSGFWNRNVSVKAALIELGKKFLASRPMAKEVIEMNIFDLIEKEAARGSRNAVAAKIFSPLAKAAGVATKVAPTAARSLNRDSQKGYRVLPKQQRDGF